MKKYLLLPVVLLIVSCSNESSKESVKSVDSVITDSTKIDSTKIDSTKIDSTKKVK